MAVFLKTDRLLLRNLTVSDEAVIYAYRNDEGCARYQRWEDTSRECVRSLIETHRQDVFLSDREEQRYGISSPEGKLLGDLAYFYTEADRCITLGITVAPEHQRKGYAFELLAAVIGAVQKAHPNLDIVALIDRENAASIALFEKLGFSRECYAENIGSYVYVINGQKL